MSSLSELTSEKSGAVPGIDERRSVQWMMLVQGPDIEQIALSIAEKKFRRAPILEGDRVVGIISRRDIIRVELYISEHPSAME